MLHHSIIDASPILRELQEPVEFSMSLEHQEILLKYLSVPFYQLPEEVWTDAILLLIDYLLLSRDKLRDYYIVYGVPFHLEQLTKFRVKVPLFNFRNVHPSHYCDVAGRYGWLEILKWAREEGHPLYNYFSLYPAAYGHIHILEWLLHNGCFDSMTCQYAALYGQLQVLKWLHLKGFPWDEWTCSNAALKGHFEILKWARENGCPWSEHTGETAVMNGDIDMFIWICENGCPIGETAWRCAHWTWPNEPYLSSSNLAKVLNARYPMIRN